MELDLRQVLRGARRWWWIVLVVPLLTGAAAYAVTARQQPLYKARATLVINPAQSSGALDYNSVLTAERLAKSYQQLITIRPVLERVIAELDLPMSTGELNAKVTARTETDTQLLHVSVSDTDPARAAAIANSVANNFAAYVVDQASQVSGETQVKLDDQIAELKGQIDEIEGQIETLEAGADAASEDTRTRLDFLRDTVGELQSLYAQLVLLRESIALNASTAGSQVTVWEPAAAPSAPYAPREQLNILLGLVAGALIAAGIVVLLVYLDNTVKSSSDFPALAGGPLLATVAQMSKLTAGRKQLFVLEQPKGPAAEAIRLLRTNIEFASATREIASLAVSSASPGEGKSTIAANLAVALAQAGFVTGLLDADLRRPSQHRIFDLPNDRGLSSLLSSDERSWNWAARPTEVPNLTVITSGPLPPNPADLLALERMRKLMLELKRTFDVIVVDTPPILAVSDPLVIATHVDGMILVTRSNKTRLDVLRRAAATLERGAVRIIGVIVNQESGRSGEGYYHAPYHAADGSPVRRRDAGKAARERDVPLDIRPAERPTAD